MNGRSRRTALIAVAAVLLLGGLVGGGVLAVHGLIDAERLERVMNGAIGPATDDRYRITVDDVEVALLSGDLTLRGIRLRPSDFGSELPSDDPAVRFSADVETVAFEGVALWRLLRHGDLEARRFGVGAPRVAVLVIERAPVPITRPAQGTTDGPPDAGAAPEAPADDSSRSAASRIGALRRELPHIQVETIAIEHVEATIVTLRRGGRGQGEAPLRERVRDLSLTLDDFRMDPSTEPSADRFLWSRDVRLEIDSMVLGGGDGATVDVGAASLSSADGSVDIAGVSLRPAHTRADFLAGQGPGGDRVELETGAVSVRGLQFQRLVEELDVVADEVRVDGVRIHILSDKHRRAPASSGLPAMPHDVIRELPLGLTVEHVEVGDGSITYAERGPRSQRPGSVTFADLQARLDHVSNAPEHLSMHGPTTLEAEARLFDAAPVHLSASIPLLSPAPTMSLFARVGGFDAGAVNAILPDLEGIRVTDGRVDSARVEIRYGPDGASGVVMVAYEDLSIRQEDRNTGDQSFGQSLTSFLANTFVIRGANRPEGGHRPREGRVDRVFAADDPFFKIFWEAIRDGLIDLAKR